jgi:hypothetical protein
MTSMVLRVSTLESLIPKCEHTHLQIDKFLQHKCNILLLNINKISGFYFLQIHYFFSLTSTQ